MSDENNKKKVKIDVDNHPHHLPPGSYVVEELKRLVNVAPDKDLDQVVDGTLTPLSDSDTVIIKGGEIFFSHVRRGGSS